MNYNIGIIDISLPVISGDEVMRVSKEVNPAIPIISISGYPDKPKKADYIIKKPFSCTTA